MDTAEKVIVIGGTAAGLSAASKAKRIKPELEITVFEKTGYISYGACGLPYFVGDMIKEPDDLVSLSVSDVVNKRGIPTYINHEVTEINRMDKTVAVRDLETGEEQTHTYDKLVIATGAVPIQPKMKGADAREVYYLRNVEDGIRLKAAVRGGNEKPATTGVLDASEIDRDRQQREAHERMCKTAAIIGGGFIGLEMAEQMTQAGLQVHVYEALDRLLPFLSETFSSAIRSELEKNGVTVHLSASVKEILQRAGESGNGSVRGIRLSDGTSEKADLVLMCIGVLPNTALAERAGLTVGLKSGIVVDDHMQTSDPSIYACGDCVQMKNRITGEACYVPLGTTANKQGRIAGSNLAGLKEIFPGVLGSMVTRVFDLTIAATGLNLQQAKKAGFEAAACEITKGDRASYYPGGRDNRLCLIFDKKTGRLLGAQGIGSESVAGRINTLATAITAEMTVSDVNGLDLVYAPPVAPVYDPILIAASQGMKLVKRY